VIFCRFDRRADDVFAASGSGTGVGSRAGALRFRDDAGVRVDVVAEGSPAELPVDPSKLAACLADERVCLLDIRM